MKLRQWVITPALLSPRSRVRIQDLANYTIQCNSPGGEGMTSRSLELRVESTQTRGLHKMPGSAPLFAWFAPFHFHSLWEINVSPLGERSPCFSVSSCAGETTVGTASYYRSAFLWPLDLKGCLSGNCHPPCLLLLFVFLFVNPHPGVFLSIAF